MRLKEGFTNELEAQFLASEQFIRLNSLRRIFIVFIVLYSAFGFTDIIFFPDRWLFLWGLRFLIVVPMLISTLLLSYHRNFLKFHQPYITINFTMGGLVIAIMLIMSPDTIIYYGGLFMVYFSGYLLIKLRYIYALIGGWTIFLFHFFGTLIYHGALPETYLYGSLFLVGANLIGMVGAYNIEKSNREQFLRDREINLVQQQLNQQNIKIKNQFLQLEAFIKENQELSDKFQHTEKLSMQLAQVEERFEDLAGQSRMLFYETNLDGLYTYVSHSVETFLGYKKEEVENNMYFYDFFPEEEREEYKRIGLKKIQNEELVDDFINPIKSKSGEIIWVTSNLRPVYDKEGKLIAYRGTDLDITEEKLAKDELQLFKTITEQSKYGSAFATLDGTLIYANQAFSQIHGYSKEEIIGCNFEMFHSIEQLAHVKKLIKTMLETGSFPAQEVWHIRKDGSVFPTIMTGQLIYDDKGNAVYLSATMVDITKEKQTELDLIKTKEALEDSRNRLQLIMDSLPIGLAVNTVEPGVIFSYMNDNFAKIYDVRREDLEREDRFWQSVYEDQDYREIIKSRVVSDVLSGDPKRMKWQDIPLKRKGKPTRYITAQNIPIPNTDIVISTVIDVTERKNKEDEIRFISNHDYLTEIPNRRYFQDQLARLDQDEHYPLGIVLMDLNGLKLINDAFGHSIGNKALKRIAKVLVKSKASDDFVARIGGDEFAMICPNTHQNEMDEKIKTINKKIATIKIENIQLSMAMGYYIKENPRKSIRIVLRNAEDNMYKNKVLSSHGLRNDAISSILQTLQDKFAEEKVHSERVSRFCKLIGQAMNLRDDEIIELEYAGLYHDIGKISVPDAILDKPSELTPKEWEIMKSHTINGYQILRAADRYSNLAEYAMSHHERIDGSGYPNALKGEDIPLYSRIISVADAYEAMTSDRPYRKALTRIEAIEELRQGAGTQFDQHIVELFVDRVLQKNPRI